MNLSEFVRFTVGEAVETLRNTTGHFGCIFVDIEKQDYPHSLIAAVSVGAPLGAKFFAADAAPTSRYSLIAAVSVGAPLGATPFFAANAAPTDIVVAIETLSLLRSLIVCSNGQADKLRFAAGGDLPC